MEIRLTEQQARSVAAAARTGLQVARINGLAIDGHSGPGDEAAAYVGCDILEHAVAVSVGKEPADG